MYSLCLTTSNSNNYMTGSRFFDIAADSILCIHCAFVAFVVAGLVLIWIGYIFNWHFVRNTIFRIIHLLAIGLVFVQTIAGRECPLTIWEQKLRMMAGQETIYQNGCIEFWINSIMFYEAPPYVFTIAYSLFFIIVCLTMVGVKPACFESESARTNNGRT